MPLENTASSASHQREQLPVEIYESILLHLGKVELSRISCASTQLYLLACPLLYAILDVNITRPLHALTCPTRLTSLVQRSEEISPSTSDDQHPSLRACLPDRLSYVTHFTLHTHHHTLCDAIMPLQMPALETLRLRSDGSKCGSLQLCPRSRDALGSQCRLLSDLRPTQLMLGGYHTGLVELEPDLWRDKAGTELEQVDHIAIIVGQYIAREKPPDYSLDWFANVSTSVKRLTFVMSTWDGTVKEDEGNTGNYPNEVDSMEWGYDVPPAPDYNFDLGFFYGMTDLLPDVFGGDVEFLEVVGFETILPDWRDADVSDTIADVRREVVERLEGRLWSEEDAKRRAASIRFIRGEDFLAEAVGAESAEERKLRKFRMEVREAVLEERRLLNKEG